MKHLVSRILNRRKKIKVIVLMGPASSGKSDMAVYLAKQFPAEIISADSRQIYRGLEVFSGAFTKKEMQGVPHHMISFVKPGVTYTAKDFEIDAMNQIDLIAKKNKVPIVAGGSAFWIEGLLYQRSFADVAINSDLRKELEQKTNTELLQIISQSDPKSAKKIDSNNRRRLIRATEIVLSLGSIPKMKKKKRNDYEFLLCYLDPEKSFLREKVTKRFLLRRDGLLEEAERLQDQLSPLQFTELGQAYKNIHQYWNKEIDLEEFTQRGIHEEVRYPKKQRTYLNKMFERYTGNKIMVDVTRVTKHRERVLKLSQYFLDN